MIHGNRVVVCGDTIEAFQTGEFVLTRQAQHQFYQAGADGKDMGRIFSLPVKMLAGFKFRVVNRLLNTVKVSLLQACKQHQMPDCTVFTMFGAASGRFYKCFFQSCSAVFSVLMRIFPVTRWPAFFRLTMAWRRQGLRIANLLRSLLL